ncbi:Helix-turn-helix transcriptional regulator [Planctomycetales bacterium 10988]|nr:Helix-turn-helix transcriptional regulator [Planctomycetales bacterium 10988]
MEKSVNKQKIYSGPCALAATFAVFASKWKPAILYHLYQVESLRHGKLRRLLPEVSQRIMTLQLRELERDGLVARKDFQEVPPRVEYSATEFAKTLLPILTDVDNWGRAQIVNVEAARRRYDEQHG